MRVIKVLRHTVLGLLISLVCLLPTNASATAVSVSTPPTPAGPVGLSIAQIKLTGDEFIVLQNNTPAIIKDLSQYSLKSFNNYNPTAIGVTSNTQQLPALALGQGQQLLLSANVRTTCGAAVAGKLSLSLIDGGGFVEVLQNATGSTQPTIVDSVSWSSTAAAVIPSVPSSTKAPLTVYYRYVTTNGFGWQQADQDLGISCQLTIQAVSGTTSLSVAPSPLLASVDQAPATIVTSQPNTEASAAGAVPDSDKGLIIPEITELLPNPNGSGNDLTDEFIELYNPNDVDFDLSGFRLQSGITSLHDFTFSSGAALPAKSFVTYYSADTGLSLSNSSGRVQLLDPSGAILIATELYGTARDGQSWALANGHWYWSLTATPGLTNVVSLPAPAVKASKVGVAASQASKSTKTSTTVKAPKIPAIKPAKTIKPKKVKAAKPIASTPTAASVTARPIRAGVVALVAALALLYGAYEYRADLANGIYKLRTKLSAGRADRG
ncbi:MAG: lamin tail domain-containing protein [Patescibacteria group bacterium]|nr:lamin tail domain-containing protein [Patescibacteria group bacterium]